MANSKNTIQNIPLEAELCMNQLRTEVKPFQGYNEKNTTVYGGTLSPIYDKKTDLFDKNNSYTVFNSKGVPYTLVKEDGVVNVYKENTKLDGLVGRYATTTEKLEVSSDAVVAAKTSWADRSYKSTLAVLKDGRITNNGEVITYRDYSQEGWPDVDVAFDFGDIVEAQIFVFNASINNSSSTHWFFNQACFAAVGRYYVNDKVHYRCQVLFPMYGNDKNVGDAYHDMDFGKTTVYNLDSDYFNGDFVITGTNDFSIGTSSGSSGLVSFGVAGKLHQMKSVYITYQLQSSTMAHVVSNGWTVQDKAFYVQSGKIGSWVAQPPYGSMLDGTGTPCIEVQQCCTRTRLGEDGTFAGCFFINEDLYGFTGKDDEGFITCPLGKGYGDFSAYYQNGALISVGYFGMPIDECLSYGRNMIFITGDSITYKKGNDWYAYVMWNAFYNWSAEQTEKLLKTLVLDNRYIVLKNNSNPGAGLIIYDIEKDEILPEKQLDWIISVPPYYDVVRLEGFEETGIVYGAGVNAGYMINGSQFVGYLPNPFILKDFPAASAVPAGTPISYGNPPATVQYYYTVGNTAQSAEYQGADPQYKDTLYPIDPNGNVVLPISANAQIIKGYSNNDLVKEGSTVYPLMYWNNNQKTYSYFLLAGMENVTDVFSLQGQQYAVDAENIYAVTYNAGVIQNANAVCYKKNMTFLGTLPTQAVFWSDFNKTFYAFTGDRILSRMFEASDINKIYYVGQNPSSLSLWICTDTGVYILSDKDMYKLDYVSKQVSFQPKTALIVTEGETINEVHAISLYLNDDEEADMIPVKLKTAYYGLGNEQKAVMDCWYLRLFDKDRTEGYVKVKVNTITDVTRHTEEKVYHVNPSDYDDNNIFYIRYQPKYQECVSMQLELETNLGIYSMALGVNTTDSATQVSKFNF